MQDVLNKVHPTTTKLKVNNIDEFNDHILLKKYQKFTKQEELTAACNMDEYYKDVLTKIFHELAVKIFGTNIVE